MNYRRSLLLSPVDVDAAGTKVIDLNFPDVISRIMIKFDATNPGSVTIQEVAAANIPKIEIVDGSNVIFSLTGMQTHALDFLDTGRQYICGGSYVPTWALSAILMINFGRFLFDPLLAFDPKKFTNPQLKITYDEDAAVASAVANSLTVFADIFDEKEAAPTGFLMNKELYDYAPVAGSTEEVDLPNDYAFRKLILQARVNNLWFGGIIGNLKLSEDNDRKIPFDLTGSQLENYVHERFGECRDGIIVGLNTITGVDCYYMPTQGIKLRGDFYCTGGLLDNVPFGFHNTFKTTTMTGYTVMDIAGTMPHGCICLPFGDQNDPADWYVPGTKSLKLKIKAGTGKTFTETFHVLTQQLRPY